MTPAPGRSKAVEAVFNSLVSMEYKNPTTRWLEAVRVSHIPTCIHRHMSHPLHGLRGIRNLVEATAWRKAGRIWHRTKAPPPARVCGLIVQSRFQKFSAIPTLIISGAFDKSCDKLRDDGWASRIPYLYASTWSIVPLFATSRAKTALTHS